MEKNKNRQIRKNIGILLFLLWTMSAMLILSVAAATSGNGSTGEAGFSWSWTTDNTLTNAAGTFNGSLSGKTLVCNISANSSTFVEEKKDNCGSVTQERQNASSTTVTATVTNNTGSTIKIADIACDKASVSGLAVNGSLESGESFTISLTATPTSDTATTSNQASGVVTITYTVVENVDIIFYGAENATFTYGEQTVSGAGDSATVMQAPGTAITLPDVTANSGTFMGWRIGDGSVQPSGTSITVNSDSAVYPVMLSGSEVYPYTVNGATYCFWEDAAYAAGTNGTIILNQNYTLPTTLAANGVSPAGGKFVKGRDGAVSYTVPTGVTLLIPFDSANTLVAKTADKNLLDTYDAALIARSEYRKLTLASGANITVANGGAISVSSKLANQFIGQVGAYGAIYMESNSNITVQSGGTLYAWGYIFHGSQGSGTVTVESGGTVYEPMSIMDYPGSSSLASSLRDANVFPMRSYALRNVEVPMTLNSGAKEYAFSCLWGSNVLVGTNPMYILLIANGSVGGETPVFQNSGGITKSYADSRQCITIDGNLTLNALTVEVAKSMGTVEISSSSTSGFYIPSCYDMIFSSGTVTLNDNVIMCEGSTLTINKYAAVDTNKKNIYILDASDDPNAVGNVAGAGAGVGGKLNGCSIDIQDVHGNYYTYVPKDAVLDINGTLNSSGGFYTSVSGACITSSEGGGVINVSGTSGNTTVKVKKTNDYAEVKINAAQLLNGDKSTYVATAKSTTTPNSYTYTNGFWRCTTHTDVATDTTPVDHICDVCGLNPCSPCVDADTDFVCDTCNKKLCVHETIEPVEASAPTCTEDGVKAHHKCTTCGAQFADAEGTTPVTAEELAEPAAGHTMNPTEAKDPTCTEAGNIAYWTCDICGKVYSDEKGEAEAQENSLVLQPTGHGWAHEGGVFTTTTTATCTEPGIKTDTCSCGEIRTEDAEALGHDEVAHEAKDPTCTEVGWDAYVTCSRCDYTTKVEKEALNHDIVIDKAVEATCTATGLTEGQHCSRCDGATVAQQTVPMAEHTSGVAATCTDPQTCTVCGTELAPALGHTAGEAATCIAPQICTVCEEVLAEAKGHTWNDATCTASKTCSVCGATEGEATGHKYEAVVTAPTCEAKGYTTHTCSVCKDSYVDTYVDATGHDMKETAAAVAPTCTVAGTTAVQSCANGCGKTEGGETVDALGHDKVNHAAQAPTCTEVGWDAYVTCSRCDYTTKVEKEALGHAWDNDCDTTCNNNCGETREITHSYDDGVVTTDPTCTDTGVKTFTCGTCSVTYTEAVDALDHDWATALTQGETQHWYDCSRCDETKDAADHSYTWTTVKEANCYQDGSKNGICVCGATATEVISATGNHSYSDTYTTEDGKHWKACTTSGCTAKSEEGTCADAAEKDHKCDVCKSVMSQCDFAVKGDVKVPGDCVTEAVHYAKCSICGAVSDTETLTGEIDSAVHTGKTDVRNEKDATCAEEGYTGDIHCSDCNVKLKSGEVVAKLTTHTYPDTWTQTKAPSCTEKGSEKRECSVCKNIETREVEMLDHTLEDMDAKAPTCTETGLAEGKKCSVCGTVTVAQEEIPAVGHTAGEVIKENEVAATCDDAGSYDNVVKCSVCGAEISRETVTVDALGHTPGVEATCTAAQTCIDCGTVIKDAIGHSYGTASYTWGENNDICTASRTCSCGDQQTKKVTVNVNTVSATCTTAGNKTYTAAFNEDWATTQTKSETIAATGHTEAVDAAVAPDCTNTGLTEGKHCSVCGEVLVAQTVVDALGHTEVIDKAKEATCTETGLTEGKHCSVCDEVIVAQEVVDALGHTEVIDKAKEATCTETGLTEGKKCSVCNEVLVAQKVVDALGHTEVIDKAKEATCTETGLTEGKHCSVCNEVLVAQNEIAAQGHTYGDAKIVWNGTTMRVTLTCEQCVEGTDGKTLEVEGAGTVKSSTQGDCENKATTTYVASVWLNGKTYTGENTIDGEYGNHNYQSIVTAPTCTEAGFTTHTCSVCNNVYTDNAVAAKGHSYDGGVQTTAPTCTAAGVKTFTCSTCGGTKTEAVAATGHNWQPATNTSPEVCSVCKKGAGEPLVRVEASDNVTVDTSENPEITQDDAKQLTENVKDIVVQVVQPEESGINKAENAGVVESGKNNLKDKNGQPVENNGKMRYSTTLTIKLQNVSVGKDDRGAAYAKKFTYDVTPYLYAMDESGEVVGQTELNAFAEPIIFRLPVPNETEATSAKVWHDNELMGYYEIHKDESGNKYVEVASTNFSVFTSEIHQHSYTETVTTAATCTEAGEKTFTCECGNDTYTEEIPALEHDMGEWTTSREATCTVAGEQRRDCSRCDHYETSVITAAGHSYGNPTWSWTGDDTNGYTAAKAIFTCACNHAEEVQATVTSQKTDATTEATGEKVYTASVTFEGKNYTDTKTVVIPKVEVTAYQVAIDDRNVLEKGTATTTLDKTKSYKPGDTFTVTSAKACVVAISMDGGNTYEELSCVAAGENTYRFAIPEKVNGDFQIGIVLEGDVNDDGVADTLDAGRILRYVAGGFIDNHTLDSLTKYSADTNDDSIPDTLDAGRILRYVAGGFADNSTMDWNTK